MLHETDIERGNHGTIRFLRPGYLHAYRNEVRKAEDVWSMEGDSPTRCRVGLQFHKSLMRISCGFLDPPARSILRAILLEVVC